MKEIFAEKFLRKHVRIAKKEGDRIYMLDGILEEMNENGIVLTGASTRILNWDAINEIILTD